MTVLDFLSKIRLPSLFVSFKALLDVVLLGFHAHLIVLIASHQIFHFRHDFVCFFFAVSYGLSAALLFLNFGLYLLLYQFGVGFLITLELFLTFKFFLFVFLDHATCSFLFELLFLSQTIFFVI